MAGHKYRTINIKLRPPEFAITNAESQYGDFFLDVLPAPNQYSVFVDWNEDEGGEPGIVKFDVNGTVYEVEATETGATRTFDMGSDFKGSLISYDNYLKITAANKYGDESIPVTLYPYVLPIPSWATKLGSFGDIKIGDGVLTYSLEKEWPKEPTKIMIDRDTLNSWQWKAWSLFPFIGGEEFGLPPTQAFLKVEAKTDGSGSIALSGSTGLKAAGQEIKGTLGGTGYLQYEQRKGLCWKGATLMIGIEGTITKEVGPVTLIPALEKSTNLPIVGKPIKWFNDKAKIKGTIKAGMDANFDIISETCEEEITFQKSHGTINAGIGLGLYVDITDGITAELSGEAMNTAYWQIPADPDYLEKVEAVLSAKLAITAWAFSKDFEGSHTFTYPETSGKRSLAKSSSPVTDFQPVSRNFLNHAPYSQFVANTSRRKRSDIDTRGAIEYKIIENVYPYSEPALAENAGKAGIAFVYFDPDDTTLQATEIYFTYYDGENYTTPAPVLNDTRAEFAPAIVFDQNGKIVAVWERVRDENFSGGSIADMAREMEIVYAVYDPSAQNWTEPISLTDNAYIDHNPILESGENGNPLLVWRSNPGNEMIGDADSPDTIHYALWDGSTFGTPGTLTGTYESCFKFSLACDGEKAILSYMKDMDGDLGTTQDEEIFYTNLDGTNWSGPIRLTDDEEADVNPEVIYGNDGTPELIWLKGNTLTRLTDWNTGASETIREGSDSVTFTDFKVARDPQNRLVLLWQDSDENGIDLFYSVYDPDNSLWSNDLRLTRDEGREKDFNGLFDSEGTLHLAYNKVNPETEANDLYHLTYKLSSDLAVSSEGLRVEPENPGPGDEVTLFCNVENAGDTALKDVPIAFYLGDPNDSGELIGTANAEPATLKAGEEGEATLSWTVPQDGTYTVYAVTDPDNTVIESDDTNNSAFFYAVKADVEAVQCKVEKYNDGIVDITAVIQNNGSVPATDVQISFKSEVSDLGVIEIPLLPAGNKAEVTKTVWADEIDATGSQSQIEVEIDPENRLTESARDNNRASILFIPNPAIKGDINGDKTVDLSDVILTLQIISDDLFVDGLYYSLASDVNGDKKIGTEEAIYILQEMAGLR